MNEKRSLEGLTAGNLLIQEQADGNIRIEQLYPKEEFLCESREDLRFLRDLLTEFLDA